MIQNPLYLLLPPLPHVNFMIITPAILAHDEADCKAKLFEPSLKGVVPRFHIDVLDGTMFDATCFADPAIIGSWKGLPEIEIHLMVSDPMKHAVAFKRFVPTLKKVIIHKEIPRSLHRVINQCMSMQLEIALAINPRTEIAGIERYENDIQELLVMGVNPGASGQTFLGEPILAKIRRARALFPEMPIAVDGGVNTATIHAITLAGATRSIAASAIWSESVPQQGLEELSRCAIMSV